MDDLVSRRATIEALEGIGSLDTEADRQYARTVFEDLPSAQPQIIYCAECTHWKHSAVRKSCEVFDWMSKAEDFCSFAERKEK